MANKSQPKKYAPFTAAELRRKFEASDPDPAKRRILWGGEVITDPRKLPDDAYLEKYYTPAESGWEPYVEFVPPAKPEPKPEPKPDGKPAEKPAAADAKPDPKPAK